MVNAKIFLATVAATVMVMPSLNEAHSWVDCMDWRFKGSKQSFDDNAGTCAGYARRFPVKYNGNQISPRYPFGSLDSTDPNRHYMQSEKHPDDWPACSTGKQYKGGDGEEVGSDETKASPVDGAYDQGKWGPMTVAKAGQQLCVRWPAKNHKDEPNNVVYINMPPTPMGQDPTQRQLNQWTIAKLDYGNCFSGGSDKARCGGCFTIPENRAPGDYLIQWRWKLNGSDNVPEWYTSCSDVRITNGKGEDAPTASADPAPTTTQKGGKSSVNKATPTSPHYKKPVPTNHGDDEDGDDNNDGEDGDDHDEDDDRDDNGSGEDEDEHDGGDNDEDEDNDEDNGEDDGEDNRDEDDDRDDNGNGEDEDEDDGGDNDEDEDNDEDNGEDDGEDNGDEDEDEDEDNDEDDDNDDEDEDDNEDDNEDYSRKAKRSSTSKYPLYNLRRNIPNSRRVLSS